MRDNIERLSLNTREVRFCLYNNSSKRWISHFLKKWTMSFAYFEKERARRTKQQCNKLPRNLWNETD